MHGIAIVVVRGCLEQIVFECIKYVFIDITECMVERSRQEYAKDMGLSSTNLTLESVFLNLLTLSMSING